MPELGEKSYGWKIGLGGYRYSPYIWAICPDCGYSRWTSHRTAKGYAPTYMCRPCNNAKHNRGANNYNWKGRLTTIKGYIDIRVSTDSKYYPMANSKKFNGGYIKEHRLVMAQHLGRCLLPWEIVHHINGVKTDNRIGNLILFNKGGHDSITTLESENTKLRTSIEDIASLISKSTGNCVDKHELINIIYPIRIRQGFNPQDYL